jgi:hypothetical protein
MAEVRWRARVKKIKGMMDGRRRPFARSASGRRFTEAESLYQK